MDGPRECHTEWSKSDRGEILSDIPCYTESKKNDTNELTYKTESRKDLENELMIAEGKRQLESLGRSCTHCYI